MAAYEIGETIVYTGESGPTHPITLSIPLPTFQHSRAG